MSRKKLVLIAITCLLCFACGSKTDVDFSIVPVKGSNEEYQYIDIAQNGKIVINPQFGKARIFRDGLALVKTSGKDGKWGYIDKKGKYIIAPTYDYAQDFNDGVAWVQQEDQPPMLIDKKGKMLLQIDSLTAAYPFNSGIAGINVYSQGKNLTMFIDKKGKSVVTTIAGEEVVPLIKDEFYLFQDKETKKWGYRNKNGETVINPQFDGAIPFFDGIAVVTIGNKLGAINKKGDIIINPQYDSLFYDSDGLFKTKIGKKWGWVNKKGEIIINPQFDAVICYCEGELAPVQMGSKWAYIDKKGQIIINPQFKHALPFNGDYAKVISKVNKDEKIGFINKKGDFVVQPLYDLEWDNFLDIYVFGINFLDLIYINFPAYERLKEKRKEWAKKAKEEALKKFIAVGGNALTDSRDGKTYRIVKIGTQIWMAENLDYAAEGSKCYDNESANCEIYGHLYNWNTAKKSCPSGWHLPSKNEWEVLDKAVGGQEVAGKNLKANSGWNYDGNGTDEFDFSALPGGHGNSDGGFFYVGGTGNWWSATDGGASLAYLRGINSSSNVDGGYNYKSNLFSVRCVQNHISIQNTNSAIPGSYPQTSERLLTDSDLQNLSKKDLRIMRNEIFARHGYIFQSDDLKAYFKNQNWYTPKYDDVNSMLTDIEARNIQFIKRYE